jgi:hypothetical protein
LALAPDIVAANTIATSNGNPSTCQPVFPEYARAAPAPAIDDRSQAPNRSFHMLDPNHAMRAPVESDG